MHRLHSIEVSETDNGHHAVVIKLQGSMDDEVERILRLEFDKTLVRERQGGVILDMKNVTEIGGIVQTRIASFARHLAHDGIEMVIVTPRNRVPALGLVSLASSFSMVPRLEMAKEMLGITE